MIFFPHYMWVENKRGLISEKEDQGTLLLTRFETR